MALYRNEYKLKWNDCPKVTNGYHGQNIANVNTTRDDGNVYRRKTVVFQEKSSKALVSFC